MTEEFKIEKGRKPPPPLRATYPFGQMEVGDSFFTTNPRYKLSAAASHYGRRNGKKFTIRAEGTGVRVFRLA